MRELHVVAVSEDGRHVLLAANREATKATHRLAIDARLSGALRGELSKRGARPARRPAAEAAGRPAASALSVREMQARMRAGESPEQIAASADLPVERVARFAGPVLSERARIIERARATRLTHSRKAQSLLPLGEVVDLHFAQMAAMRPETVRWTTRREDAGTWLVEVHYIARARARSGSWRFDPAAGTLVAADAVSAGLGHSDTLDGTPASRPPRARAAAVRRAPSVAVGKRAATPRTPANHAPAKAAAAAKTAAAKAGAPGASGVAAKQAAPAGGPPALRVVPAFDQLPRTPAPEPAAAAPPASAERAPAKRAAGPRGRASVPAWADVLLSTSPPPPRPSDEAAD